jgi:hypothetical protein
MEVGKIFGVVGDEGALARVWWYRMMSSLVDGPYVQRQHGVGRVFSERIC